MVSTTTLGATLLLAAAAQAAKGPQVHLEQRVGLATACFGYNGKPGGGGLDNHLSLGPAPTIKPASKPGLAITVEVIAPSCPECQCTKAGAACTATYVYETTYSAFNSAGALTAVTYSVSELYPGVAATATPAVVTVDCPLGFTTTVATCTAGPTPVTATLTVPVTTCPYVTGISSPSPVPAGVSVSPFELATASAAVPVASGSAEGGKAAGAGSAASGSSDSDSESGAIGQAAPGAASGAAAGAAATGTAAAAAAPPADSAAAAPAPASPNAGADTSSSSPAEAESAAPPAAGASTTPSTAAGANTAPSASSDGKYPPIPPTASRCEHVTNIDVCVSASSPAITKSAGSRPLASVFLASVVGLFISLVASM